MLRLLFIMLFCGLACTLRGQEDRIWMDITINGQPVHMAFDTGATVSALFRGTADRLKLKRTDPPPGFQPPPGAITGAITEPFDFAYGNFVERAQFAVVEMPAFAETVVEGFLSWYGLRNRVFVFDPAKNHLDIGDVVPPGVLGWPKFNQRTNTADLGFDVGGEDPQHHCVYLDTGADYGVSLNPKLWEKWVAAHPQQPATIHSATTVMTGPLYAPEMWADEIAIGSLVLTQVPVREMDAKEASPLFMPDQAATLGLAALRRLDFVLDGTNGVVYARPSGTPARPYPHNRLGAVFAPRADDSDPLLARVAPASPAYLAGLRDGDVLLKIDDLDVTHWRTAPGVMPLRRFWCDRPPGTTYRLSLKRGEKEFQTTVTLRHLLGPEAAVPAPSPASPGAVNPQGLADLQAKAQSGDPQAQYDLGVALLSGKLGLAKDEVEAAKWFRKAADQNHAGAQSYLGAYYSQGRGVTQDVPEAVRWWRKAAEQNYASAQTDLGVCYYNGLGVAKDEVEGMKWFRRAAEQNYPVAQSYLGSCYLQGRGVAPDAVEAVRWFRKAIELNDASAQNNLGLCYADGAGVPQDMAEAVSWFRKAAAQDYDAAQGNLGAFYFAGRGVEKDEAEAVRWWRQAATRGDVKSQFNLGACYLKGLGVAKDAAAAVKWSRQAAEANYADAQANLALCYVEGNGVAKDEVEGYKWALLAAAQGHQNAKNLGALLAERLSPKQILDGQKRARDFKPRLTAPAYSITPRVPLPASAPSTAR